jgi:hypothetical protein
MIDESGNVIKEIAPKLINPSYKGDITAPTISRQLHVPQPQPEYRVHTDTLLTRLGSFLGDTKVTLDNISSIVSQSMVYASDFSDLSGSKKRAVVLNAVGNIAITQANSPNDARLNTEFVSRSAGTFIDALCAANKRQVIYVTESKGLPDVVADPNDQAGAPVLERHSSPPTDAPTAGDAMQRQIIETVTGGEKIHKMAKKGASFFTCCSAQNVE